MAHSKSTLSSSGAFAFVVGVLLLSAGSSFAASVKYRESYIVRYQDAKCNGANGKLVLKGSAVPIVLSASDNLQVLTTAAGSAKVAKDLWNQTLKEAPDSYAIQNFIGENSYNCMTVEADVDPNSILALDVCSSSPTTNQWFDYEVVKSASGCATSNKNGFAVLLHPRSPKDIGSNLCVSAPKTAGVSATLQTCNKADESQLFFVNVPSIRRE